MPAEAANAKPEPPGESPRAVSPELGVDSGRGEAAETTECRHCGLPVPPGSRHPGFCCPGCKKVHELLHGSGLEEFYGLGGGKGRPVGSETREAKHDWISELEAQGRVGEAVRIELDVQGIYCAACVWVLQELWRRRPGALSMDLNPSLGQVVLIYKPGELSLSNYLDEVEALGYRMAPARKERARKDRSLLIRLGICVSLSLNAMMFAFAHYLGMDARDQSVYELFRWLSLGIATLAVLIGGPVFFKAALAGLRHRLLHLDLPIALGILLAYGGSLWWFFHKSGTSYFDTVTIFVTLMLLGRFLQDRAVRRNRDYLLRNDGAEHLRVRRDLGDRLEMVPVTEVRPGDRLWITPGDLVPVKGVLIAEPRSFSLEWINGESQERLFQPGEEIPAGAFLAGRERARVDALADAQDSGLLDLLRSTEGDREGLLLSPFWSRLNRIYVLLVLGFATMGALLWYLLDPSQILPVVISILVVTCPCALGLAIPLAIDLALARLRRNGIFVRRTELLDKASRWRRVFFDKTGTLTWGGLQAEQQGELTVEQGDLLLTLASSSHHPVSQAVAARLSGVSEARIWTDPEVVEVVGKGVQTLWQGHEYRLGRPGWAGPENPEGSCAEATFSRDGHPLAQFRVQEDFRPGYAEAIAGLEASGIEVHLISGDRQARVAEAGRRLGLDPARVLGDQSPEDKAAYVRRLDQGQGLMVGDGLNDAPAFREASSTATPALDRPVLPSQADFYYVGAGASAVSHVRETSRLLHRVVASNLALAVVYNLGALSLAFSGIMTPLLCAVLMPTSSLVLIAHSYLRLRGSGITQVVGTKYLEFNEPQPVGAWT